MQHTLYFDYQKSITYLFYLIDQPFISSSEKIRLLALQKRLLLEWQAVMNRKKLKNRITYG